MHGAIASRARERVEDQSQLFLAADQRRERGPIVRRPELRHHAMRLVHRDGIRLSLRLEHPAIAVLDCPPRCEKRRLADQDARRVGGLFDPERGRHDVSGSDPLFSTRPCLELHDGFTRVHGDLDPCDRIANRERGADRALRVVLVCHRSAEDSHHGVADVFLERAAKALKFGSHPRDLWTNRRAQLFWISVVAEYCRIDEIGKENRDDLSLLAAERDDGGPARGTEAGALREPRAALGARGHATSIGRSRPCA